MGKPRLAMSMLGAILAPKARLQEWSRLVQISEYLSRAIDLVLCLAVATPQGGVLGKPLLGGL